jgi:hypothetical protein
MWSLWDNNRWKWKHKPNDNSKQPPIDINGFLGLGQSESNRSQ